VAPKSPEFVESGGVALLEMRSGGVLRLEYSPRSKSSLRGRGALVGQLVVGPVIKEESAAFFLRWVAEAPLLSRPFCAAACRVVVAPLFEGRGARAFSGAFFKEGIFSKEGGGPRYLRPRI